ncbi:MAG: hydrogenase maturation protease [Promethearchaeota archaeon]
MNDFYLKLSNRLSDASKIVFMGIGEEKLTDDGVGPYIISELLPHANENVLFINGGIDPMSRVEDIISFTPSHLVLIDTCTLNGPPGTVAILAREDINDYVPISTHTIPVHIVIDLITKKLPDLNVFMIGIVPENLEGIMELNQYGEGAISLEEFSKNIDLPFFQINLTKTIQYVADQLIIMIKKLMDK